MSYEQLFELLGQLKGGVKKLQDNLLAELDIGLQHYSEELDRCKTKIPVRLKEFGGLDIFATIIQRIVDEEIISTVISGEEEIWGNVKNILSSTIDGINRSTDEISHYVKDLVKNIEGSPEVSMLKDKLSEKEEKIDGLTQAIEEYRGEVETLEEKATRLISELRAKEDAFERMKSEMPNDARELVEIVEQQKQRMKSQEDDIISLSERIAGMETEVNNKEERWNRLMNMVTDDMRYSWFFTLAGLGGWMELKRLIVGHPTTYVVERWVKPLKDRGLVEMREENGKYLVKAKEFL